MIKEELLKTIQVVCAMPESAEKALLLRTLTDAFVTESYPVMAKRVDGSWISVSDASATGWIDLS